MGEKSCVILKSAEDRLQKAAFLEDHKEKWYRVGEGWIHCEEQTHMVNPNGSWHWHGWEVGAHEYWITVFPEECVEEMYMDDRWMKSDPELPFT